MFYPESMPTIDRVLEANRRNALQYDPKQVSPRPSLHLAVLTCMDTRISLPSLGLKVGEAHMIRNAGGIATDDAVRSLVISHYLLGTNEIMVINHTDCGLMKASEEELHQRIESESGTPSSSIVNFHAFQDVEDNVRRQLYRLKTHSWLQGRVNIRGFVFEVENGHLREVE